MIDLDVQKDRMKRSKNDKIDYKELLWWGFFGIMGIYWVGLAFLGPRNGDYVVSASKGFDIHYLTIAGVSITLIGWSVYGICKLFKD